MDLGGKRDRLFEVGESPDVAGSAARETAQLEQPGANFTEAETLGDRQAFVGQGDSVFELAVEDMGAGLS